MQPFYYSKHFIDRYEVEDDIFGHFRKKFEWNSYYLIDFKETMLIEKYKYKFSKKYDRDHFDLLTSIIDV